jgi:hypothetical protein
MNPFTIAGVVVAIICLAAYLLIAVVKKKQPDLSDALIIVISALAVPGAIRVFLTALRPEFWAVMKQVPQSEALSLSSEDAVFILVGSIALLWLAVSAGFQPFKKIW